MSLPKVFTSALDRANDFLTNTTFKKYVDLCKNAPAGLMENIVPVLLFGVFLSMRQLVDASLRAGHFFEITPFALKAGVARRVVEKNVEGRARFVRVWVDSLVGLPDAVLRVGTSKGGTTAGGVRLTSGVMNEVGQIPANNELWLVSDVDVNVYIAEEA